jgi:pilus assembly protein CpaC
MALTVTLGGCRAPQAAARRPLPPPSRAAGDAILYDQEFWAEGPAPEGATAGAEPASVSGGSHGGVNDEGGAAAAHGDGVGAPVLAAMGVAAGAEAGAAQAEAPEAEASADVYAAANPEYTAGAPSVTEVTATPRAGGLPRSNGAGESRIISNFEGALHVPAGRSVIIRLSRPAERVAIADPDVAEVVVISPQEVLVNGKGRQMKLDDGRVVTREAQTSLVVWDRDGRSDMRTLYVNRSRTEQILLETTVAELNRTALERYGFDFAFNQSGHFVLSNPSKVVRPGESLPSVFPGLTQLGDSFRLDASRLTAFYGSFDDQFALFLEALQEEALAKILARPVVLARSGEQAHLRVGGEVPVVYATANVATITFKEFGVLITMTPEFTDNGQIDLTVAMEVSEPTSAFATSFAGFDVPSFVGRRAQTRVVLDEDDTLLIGGLYREQTSEDEQKVPYLGDIPWLGFAFRRTTFETVRTETVMTVRPRVARSPDMLQVNRLPTDRGPFQRGEVRTQPNPYGVTRPRVIRPPTAPPPPSRRSPADYAAPPAAGE